MEQVRLADTEEVFFSTKATSAYVSRRVAAGRLRKIGPRLYTPNLAENPETLVRRYLWDIVAGYFPGGLIADRTALELKPASADGSIFLEAGKDSVVELPGVTLRARRGVIRHPTDFMLREGLYCMATARALLENMRPSRSRQTVRRTLRRAEIEVWLESFMRDSGRERLNGLRDQIRAVASDLNMHSAGGELDGIIGALLGTRDVSLSSPVAQARARGMAFDARRVELFELLHDAFRRLAPEPVRVWRPEGQSAINQAFFEAYFSNFIEGTEFSVRQAEDIVFGGSIPAERPADAHDVLGTFRLVSNAAEMARLPGTAEEFLEILRARHEVIMRGRPENTPGVFKQRANQFGMLEFVAPDAVAGTLTEGFRIYRRLTEPFERAVFMMFLVSEVHPFADGNGRVARVMMNAELASAGQVRILIPVSYRLNYLSALRGLSGSRQPEALIRALGFAQRYVAAVPWNDMETAIDVLTRTNAFLKPEEAEERGLRLRIPGASDLVF